MATTVWKAPLRGNVVDLVQHHDWLLIAAHHSEGQNLGLQAIPIREEKNEPIISIHTPTIMKALVALADSSSEEGFVPGSGIGQRVFALGNDKHVYRVPKLAPC